MQARRILGLSLVLVAIGAALALRFSQTSAAPAAVKPGDVNEERIAADAVTGVNWLVNGRTNDSKHFSPLKEINSSNVSNLGLAWYLDRKSTRLNSSHGYISYAVFCLKTKKSLDG